MRWLKEISNGKIWSMQSHATAGTLIKGWVNSGGNAGDVVEVTGTEAEYEQALKDAVSLVDYQTEQKKVVKRLAFAKITTIIPEWKQRNYTARIVELLNKERTGGVLTNAEEIEITNIDAIWTRAKAIRTASNMIEAEIDALGDKSAVVTYMSTIEGNVNWP